jgi:hypothetical protein
MNNFKSGSGNLDFGGEDGGDDERRTDTESDEEVPEPAAGASPSTGAQGEASSRPAGRGDQPTPDREPRETGEPDSRVTEYPYFVRRNNVGDERETRLEIHVRDKVADREAEFRNELATRLGTSEVSKTDAREFALLAAFEDPDRVAGLMRAEGFGALD